MGLGRVTASALAVPAYGEAVAYGEPRVRLSPVPLVLLLRTRTKLRNEAGVSLRESPSADG